MRSRAPSLFGLAIFLAANAFAQSTELSSTNSSGIQGNGVSGYFRSALSADGRYVAFASEAQNLVAGDTNAKRDVFVHDRLTGTTERVSVDTSGAEGNADSEDPGLSADGRWVAFSSLASNLVPGDTNNSSDVFVRDRLTGTTQRVSLDSNGTPGNGTSHTPSISADGRYVAFASGATNLVTGDTNGRADVFVRDLVQGTTQRVSVATGGGQANASSDEPAISADGRFVSFDSEASNLFAGDTNGEDVFVHDGLTGATEQVDVSTSGTPAIGISGQSTICADGRYIAFFSVASNLVAGDTNGAPDIFLRDRLSGTTTRVSVAGNGAQADSASLFASISADGRFVSFNSFATNLVQNDTNAVRDIFVRDLLAGSTERVSLATSGSQPDLDSMMDVISADGRFVTFSSDATNLVSGDTNGAGDVFVHDRGPLPAISPYCSGDGSGTACPCGLGSAGNGCPSSVNPAGASLAASGSASLSVDTLLLTGSGMPDVSALYFQGSSPANGGLGNVFGDGLRCAAGTIVRLGTKTNAGGTSLYPSTGDTQVSVRGQVTTPGLRAYQVWYRNAAVFCTPATFNLTNGLLVIWTS